MSKDFSEEIKKNTSPFQQPVPADPQSEKELETKAKNGTALQIALDIIDQFRLLDSASQNIVLNRLKDISIRQQLDLDEKTVLNLDQAADFLGVTTRTIKNYLSSGKLSGKKEKNKWYFSLEQLRQIKK